MTERLYFPEVEAERRLVSQRRRRLPQVLFLRYRGHEVGGIEILLMLGHPVGIIVGRMDHVFSRHLVANRQREMAGGTALGRPVADQELHVVTIVAQRFGDRVDVARLPPVFGSQVGGEGGGRQRRREQAARCGNQARAHVRPRRAPARPRPAPASSSSGPASLSAPRPTAVAGSAGRRAGRDTGPACAARSSAAARRARAARST